MPITDDEVTQEIHRRRMDGETVRAIADGVGVSRYRVESALRSFHASETRAQEPVSVAGLAGGRVTIDRPGESVLASLPFAMPSSDDGSVQYFNWLDADALSKKPLHRILEIAINSSPELSRGLWDFLRLTMPGHEVKVFKPGTRDEDEEAAAVLNAFRDVLRWRYGAEEIPYSRLFIGAAMRGAMVAELVLDDQFVAVDLATPDPATIKFRRKKDPVLGSVWEMGQWQGSKWVPIDRPTVRYIPIDPMPGKPYGRSLMAPALFPSLFLLGFFQDLKRVVANQGYPRTDVEVSLDAIYGLLTGGDEDKEGEVDPKKAEQLMRQLVQSTIASFGNMQPGDTFVHSSLVKVNNPVGALNASSLGMIGDIIEALERECVRAIKSMPLLFGITDNTSEANANRQWEIHIAGIKSIQHLGENLLEAEYEMLLQAAGYLCTVEFRFAEVRASEEFRDAQTMQAKIANYLSLMDKGMVTPNEAAEELLGYISDAVALTYDDPDGSAAGSGDVAVEGTDDGTGTSTDGAEPVSGDNARYRGKNRSQKFTKRDGTPGDDETEPITTAEIDDAIAWFDGGEDDYAGILDAQVIDPDDDESRMQRASAPGDISDVWGYDTERKRYTRLSTGKTVSTSTVTAMRNRIADHADANFTSLVNRYYDGKITSLQFRLEGEAIIKRSQVTNYLLGRGGRNMATNTDWGHTGQLVKKQYGYWRGMTDDVTNGRISRDMAMSRASMYAGSSTTAHERGKAAAYGIEGIPHFPGETQCLGRCRCSLKYEETEKELRVTWHRNNSAESCEDCVAFEQEMNPWISTKQ